MLQDNNKIPIYFVQWVDPPVVCQPSINELRDLQNSCEPVKMVVPANYWLKSSVRGFNKLKVTNRAEDYVIKGISPIRAKIHKKYGLLGLFQTTLDRVIKPNRWYPNEYIFEMVSLCSVTHHNAIYKNGIWYCEKIKPMGFIKQDDAGGCNQGCRIFFPYAEKFSACIKRQMFGLRHRSKKDQELSHISTRIAVNAFGPSIFENNAKIDNTLDGFKWRAINYSWHKK